jgi:hypothetical protein
MVWELWSTHTHTHTHTLCNMGCATVKCLAEDDIKPSTPSLSITHTCEWTYARTHSNIYPLFVFFVSPYAIVLTSIFQWLNRYILHQWNFVSAFVFCHPCTTSTTVYDLAAQAHTVYQGAMAIQVRFAFTIVEAEIEPFCASHCSRPSVCRWEAEGRGMAAPVDPCRPTPYSADTCHCMW